MTRALLLSSVLAALTACNTVMHKTDTLADLDRPTKAPAPEEQPLAVEKQRAREAYIDYLNNTGSGDTSRAQALSRLAEIELEASLLSAAAQEDVLIEQDEATRRRLQTSIDLYQTTLRDYPQHFGNDRVLYQLAKAYEITAQRARLVETLETLVSRYPKSDFYTEAQFRLGEAYFVQGDYVLAEDAYTEVLKDKRAEAFTSRARYKRGWARFKQELYWEALDDYFRVLEFYVRRSRVVGPQLSLADREMASDCRRAISLSFSYLGGAKAIEEYFAADPENANVAQAHRSLGDLYLHQNRYSDAAQTYYGFLQTHANHEDAPSLLLATIDAWEKSPFVDQQLEARKEFEKRFGVNSRFWRQHELDAFPDIYKETRNNILQLASHYHGTYQEAQQSADFRQAGRWYKHYLETYPEDRESARVNYLYAELLAEHGDLDAALDQYESAVRIYAGHPDGADAAYAALSTADALAKRSHGRAQGRWSERSIQHTRHFATHYGQDARAPEAVVYATDVLYRQGRYDEAVEMAAILQTTASPRHESKLLLAQARSHFQLAQHDQAEAHYRRLLSLNAIEARERKEIEEQLASSIYLQGEAASKAGNRAAAAQHFLRVRDTVPQASIVPTAEYDTAALFIAMDQWNDAVTILTRLRAEHPNHALQPEVTRKLAVAYMNQGQAAQSAREFELLAGGQQQDATLRRDALWQAAELYEDNGNRHAAINAYARYANEFPQPAARSIEAMNKLVELYGTTGDTKGQMTWRARIVAADREAGDERTERTKYLASAAALSLADARYHDFQRVQLRQPLKKSLLLKKSAMEAAVQAYGVVAGYGFTESITHSTLRIGKIYAEFSRSILESERPRNLSELELEQYNILLEDQAYQFEEKAIEFFEINVARIKQGIFDDSVNASLAQLGELFPARYNRNEKLEPFIETVN